MKRYTFRQQQFLPISLETAWSFFSDPRNLARITPAHLGFKIISAPEQCVEGSIIEYRVKPLLGIPLKWVSLISDVKAPVEFVDTQVQGPYRYWHHRHTFEKVAGGILMKDVIHYELSFDWFSPWINNVIVAKELAKIFSFRYKYLNDLFGNRGEG